MTAPVSAKKSYFRINFEQGFFHKKLWIVLLIVNVLSMPYVLASIYFFGADSFISLSLSGLALVINVILGIVIPFIQFDYLYQKSKVDMAYALPLTRKQKFLSDFSAGFCMYVGAFFIQYGLSLLLSVIIYATNSKASFAGGRDYALIRLNQAGLTDFISMLTKNLAIILLMQIMLYVVTTLILSFTGSVFEAVSAVVYTNILIPTTIYVIYNLFTSHLFGMDFEDVVGAIISKSSPLGGFLYLLGFLGNRGNFSSWILWYVAITLIYFAAAYLIITRRRPEAVGKPFVIRPFYHIIIVAVMLHIGVLACYTRYFLITFIISTALFYLVMEFITNRGFKRIKQSLIQYAAVVVTSLALILLINETDSFGMAYHVPELNKVQQISIGYPGISSNRSYINADLIDRNNIETLLEVQKAVIADYREAKKNRDGGIFNLSLDNQNYMYQNVPTSWLRIDIKLKNGSRSIRQYNIPYEQILYLVDVELSTEVVNARIDHWKQHISSLEIKDIYGINSKSLATDAIPSKSEVINEFLECYRKDLLSVTKEEYITPNSSTQYLASTDYGDLVILDSYSNTLEFLKKYNVELEVTDDDLLNLYKIQGIDIYYKDNTAGTVNVAYRNINDTDVVTLLRLAKAQYSTMSSCYEISLRHITLTIPVEYNKMVEKLITNN